MTVVYALPDGAALREVRLAEGATVADAIQASDLARDFPELQNGFAGVGIFAAPVALDCPLTEGDRVELYRPLRADPKETRRRRAAHRRAQRGEGR